MWREEDGETFAVKERKNYGYTVGVENRNTVGVEIEMRIK